MKIEFFEETNFSYRRKQDLEKDLNLHWIARNMAGDKVGDIPAILQVLQHPLTTESENIWPRRMAGASRRCSPRWH